MVSTHYDTLSPNAKMLALRKEKQRKEEEIKVLESQMRDLEAQYTKCECGFLFDSKNVQQQCEERIEQIYRHSKCEFDDSYYEDVKYIDFVYYCPVCGGRHLINDIFIGVI